MIRREIPWLGGPSVKQYFSLPSSIIYYMAKNPSSPEVYNKLIESCKYFFEKNPILVAKNMEESIICANENCASSNEECCVDLDIKKIKSKIWLTDELNVVGDEIANFTSLLCPKLYRCNLVEVSLCDMDVLFEDFKCLVSSVKYINLDNVKMTYNDGKPVVLEKILEVIPNVEDFFYEFCDGISAATSSTIKNIVKLQNLGNLKTFSLGNVPEVFNVEELSDFMKNHRDTKITLDFIGNCSPEYADRLEALIDTIILSDIYYRVIMFDGQDLEKLKIMEHRSIDPDDDEDMYALSDFGSDVDSDFDMEDIDGDDDVDEMEDIDEDDIVDEVHDINGDDAVDEMEDIDEDDNVVEMDDIDEDDADV